MKFSLPCHATHAIAAVTPINPPWKLIPPSHSRISFHETKPSPEKSVKALGMPVSPPV